ncbi:hypothetical protein SAMN04489760_103208 [Syntrophus gentianae]|uniref:Uncharacterized protein n=1 Tax=Syntrophus gentianae TaxID=43775 RepID=A0A1H7VE82_9BACT|nr:hypothetical protein SAMN04489760_103208 [Syntrophus gentianae]
MRLEPARVGRVLSLFDSSGHDCILCTTLEGLGVELGSNMAASIESFPGLNKAIAEGFQRMESSLENLRLSLVDDQRFKDSILAFRPVKDEQKCKGISKRLGHPDAVDAEPGRKEPQKGEQNKGFATDK